MEADSNPSIFDVPASSSVGSTTVIPQSQSQQTMANLDNGASISFDFSADLAPFFDFWVYADRALDLAVFIRQSETDTYRQWGGLFSMAAASQLAVLLQGMRIPGSNVRLQLQNNSGAATTTLSAQGHMRSL